ncbi:polynucleotide adenylyltransferase PcnB [Acidobacteriota bacterium]
MQPKIVPRPEHNISRKNIEHDALKVLYRLHRSGKTAYLVGGGLRDLLLERKPKDFDICTSARPGEIRKLFRNSRIIGRRFRLVHVFFKNNIIEVSTFRKKSEFLQEPEDGDIMVRRENTFGTAEEDALRRDFTINGLFYEIGSFSVIDYIGGLEDIKARMIRSIGDPEIRFREDPVRMLRAIKFASRLDFDIEENTLAAIMKYRNDVLKCPKARVLEEIYRILGSGSSRRAIELMIETGMLNTLFPEIDDAIKGTGAFEIRSRLLNLLKSMDDLVIQGITVLPPVLLGTLYEPLITPLRRSMEQGEGSYLGQLMDTIKPHLRRTTVSKKDQERFFQCLVALPRFKPLLKRGFLPRSLVKKIYFPQAFALFSVHSMTDDVEMGQIVRWQRRYLTEHKGAAPKGQQRQRQGKPGMGRTPASNPKRAPNRRKIRKKKTT